MSENAIRDHLVSLITVAISKESELTDVDVNEPFFELGLNSLQAIAALARVEGQLPIPLSLVPLLMDGPSIFELATTVESELEPDEVEQMKAGLESGSAAPAPAASAPVNAGGGAVPDESRPGRTLSILMTTQGTLGSIEPMLGLAQRLMQRGHSVVMAAPEPLAERSRQFVETVTLETRGGSSRVLSGPGASDPLLANLSRELPAVPGYFEQLRELCAGRDLLIAFPFQLAAPMIRDAMDIPYVSLHFSPFSFLAQPETIRATADMINPVRSELGLASVKDPLGRDAESETLSLFAVSQHVFHRPKSWPDNHEVTGYFFSKDDVTPPDEALKSFVESGPPPVVVTLGSVILSDPGAVTEMVMQASKNLDIRVVLQRGWGGLGSESVPDNVYVADFVPHSWLLPRASVVVHAGGAGTTAAAFRAGVPTIVVPHVLDQPLWAAQTKSLGTGRVLPFQELTAESLADAIADVTSDDSYQAKASQLAKRIASDDGVGIAIARIEKAFCGPAK